ncbi:radical SAM protein, partial [bacterium]|nr:radical SAM protein [bacterium]
MYPRGNIPRPPEATVQPGAPEPGPEISTYHHHRTNPTTDPRRRHDHPPRSTRIHPALRPLERPRPRLPVTTPRQAPRSADPARACARPTDRQEPAMPLANDAPARAAVRRAYRLLGKLNRIVNRLEREAGRTRLVSRPVTVDLVITKACNLACVFCKDYDTPTGAQRASLPAIERLARQVFPYASSLNICSGGEPYLHRDLLDILRVGRRYGLDTWLLSNGMLMNDDVMRTIVTEQLVTAHGISYDGIDPDTVAAIRVGADPARIVASARHLLRLRRELGARHPRLVIRYAMMRSNIEQLSAAVDFWGRMGADEIHASYLSLANGMDPDESLYHHQDLYAAMRSAAHVVATGYPRLRLKTPPTVAEERERPTPRDCRSPWTFVMIDANGEVMPCYRSFEA